MRNPFSINNKPIPTKNRTAKLKSLISHITQEIKNKFT